MPLPLGTVGASCDSPNMPSDVRSDPLWLIDVASLVDQMQRPFMRELTHAGAVLIKGWIAA